MPSVRTFLRILDTTLRLRGIPRKTLDGARPVPISYREAGRQDRPTMVLVHGLGTDGLSWVKVIGRLARRYHLLIPDLPGWGWSKLPEGRDHATIHELRDAIISFLEGVAKGPVVLVGQSLGGWASAKAAAARPDLVKRLVLVNSAGVLYPEVDELRQRLDFKSQDEVVAFWHDLYHRVPWFYRFFSDDYVAKMHEPRVLSFFQSLTEESVFVNQDLAKITMPTTVIWGLSDRFIPRKTVDVLVAGLPDVKVHWLPDCGHVPALERPKEFIRVLKASVDGTSEA